MTDARAFRSFRFPAEVILRAAHLYRLYLQFLIRRRELATVLADRDVQVEPRLASALVPAIRA
ncbi:hypothetical protein [Marinivivus vitaminiproducens]|uniref:hypothetical protein n=1 Tax=Marinivivus vitaminiproducens TaxID=3035935 RepID=UPI002799EE1D|nr:hypothetical protein P4R82_23640 [Geminicoccaceae bacterium SCSIO 64248]